MKLIYKQKIFFSFLFIFILFTTGIILFERSQERKYKTKMQEEKLDAYTDMANVVLKRYHTVDSLLPLLPENMRLTLIDQKGVVLFDNVIGNNQTIENHAERPEIIAARNHGKGAHIRTSHSNQQNYLYYAKRFDNQYIRMALPYDIVLKNFLKPNNLFLYFLILLFIVTLFLLLYASNIFGKSIKKLKDFTDAAEQNKLGRQKMEFPEDELGEIGRKIAHNYQQLAESKKSIALEREKLLQHVYSSEEGICFFSAERKVEFYNGLFMQYLNIIMRESNNNPADIFSDIHFEKINSFFSQQEKNDRYYETKIASQGKILTARVNVFENNSFEIVLNDITKQEKTRLLKQEMTGNITHELRTPVTGIRGCLETVLEHNLDSNKQRVFIQNAYNQTLVLSELIQDLGLLTKIEDAPRSFSTEEVNILKLIEDLNNDLEYALKEKNDKMEWNIPENTMIVGNKNLLYSIFRNLTDNAIRYAGSNISIQIKQYNEDKDFYYFSFADNGTGISEEHHLNRLFERFYRINEGRTRDTGGSGLGLSIVKNAVLFHHGTIIVKNRVTGGLEFLFTLRKY
jgi:signal transduction histidine kinase